MKLLTPTEDRLMVQHVLPAAIRCFFHVYEEPIGNYALSVLRHVLVEPDSSLKMKTGCQRVVDSHLHVTVTNDVVVDRAWCRTCAAVVAREALRGHAPTPLDQILARTVTRTLTKEVL